MNAGLSVTAERNELKGADAYFICVPSPLGPSGEPDLAFIRAATDLVVGVVEPGALVSLESTTYPGTTDDVIVGALDAEGFRIDEDVFGGVLT